MANNTDIKKKKTASELEMEAPELDKNFGLDEEEDADSEAPPEYKVRLHDPVLYNGEELTELDFDFSRLTGKDAQSISRELTRRGISVFSPALSDDYLIRMAVKGCVNKMIGTDLFQELSLLDYNRILLKARNFLLTSA